MLPRDFFAPPYLGGRLVAIHFRHLNIHQDNIERVALQHLHGFHSVIGNGKSVSPLTQDLRYQLLVDGMVLGDQHLQAPRRCRRHRLSACSVHYGGAGVIHYIDCRHDGVKQLGLLDRLPEETCDAQRFTALDFPGHVA